jgi:hypothetical protein
MLRTVAELTQAILGMLKEEDAGRVALYHYLKNFTGADEPVTPELINRFYAEALQLPHWQSKRQELHVDIQDLLQKFFSQSHSGFRLDHVWNLARIQLIMIEHPENLYVTVKNHEQSHLLEGENLRVMQDGNTRSVAIKRGAAGDITVRTYSNIVRVHGDRLIPLGPDQELSYDAGLELLTHRMQRLKTSAHNQVRFVMRSPQEIEAQFVSGFAFRQAQVAKIAALTQEPRIFYPLKRLERFYVYRPSDPYYMEIISSLDRALRMLHAKAEGAEQYALQAFDGGQIAFDQIFPDDKALYSRLRELARIISSRQREVSGEPQQRRISSRTTPEIHR